MSVVTGTPRCVGINIPAQASYPTREVAGHKLVDLPGGLFVMGSSVFEDAPPRWVGLDRYSIATTATSEGQHRETTGKAGIPEAPMNHPMTMVSSYHNVLNYLAKRGGELTLLTEAQWENAARGPAVNIQELMEEEGVRRGDFVDFVKNRFENPVIESQGEIITDIQNARMLVERGVVIYMWRQFGTPSGRLTHDEAWYNQDGTAPVDWGPPNAYGLYGMAGGVCEWVNDWYERNVNMSDVWNPTGPSIGHHQVLRGASWLHSEHKALCVGCRFHNGLPGVRYDSIGFRVASPHGSRG